MKIYTKTGDKGKTSLGDGQRVFKNSKRVESYGTLDELNSQLGVLIAELDTLKKPYAKKLLPLLDQIQKDLFAIQSNIANPQQQEIISFLPPQTKKLEETIDTLTEKLPQITNFILPSGGRTASLLHVIRTLIRRAERRLVDLLQEDEVDERVIAYINRLSDLFFTMARFASYNEKKKERIWSKSLYLKKIG